jgi:uncharacterized protein YggE
MSMTPRSLARQSLIALSIVLAPIAQASAETIDTRRLISVEGQGQILASANEASITGGSRTEGRTAQAALEANARVMRAVQTALKEAGIAERDIRTTSLTVQPVMDHSVPGRPRVTGYAANHQLQVVVRDLAKTGDVIDRMITAGANTMGGLQLMVSDTSKKMDEARVAAIADARRKAELMVAAAGAKLGRVVTIQDNDRGAPQPLMRARALAAAAPVAETQIAAGEQTFSVSISATWEIID